MILINLLPHREEKRRQRKRAYFASLAACAVAGVAIVGIWYTVLGQMTADQESRNAFLQAEISRLDAQIKDIATLRAEIDALNARKRAVEDLQNDRNVPVHLLNELVRQTPEGVFLTSVRQAGQVISITGVAQTNERVSEFLRNTLYNSTWLEKPDLVEIRASSAAARDQRRLFDFSMRVTIKRQQAVTPAAAAAPAAAPGAAPAAAKAS
ncbi:MAG: PilN domain-containing protein [Hydrogenophaga sp.]|nr:PilN domain-containing protein [Hydrogenophaga sp.]